MSCSSAHALTFLVCCAATPTVDANVKITQLQQLHGSTPARASDALLATSTTPHMESAGDGIQQRRPPSKRVYGTLRSAKGLDNVPRHSVDEPAVKKVRSVRGGPMHAQPCDVAAAKEATALLPVPSLFKPSRNLELFVPSLKLESGAAWIVTWLP